MSEPARSAVEASAIQLGPQRRTWQAGDSEPFTWWAGGEPNRGTSENCAHLWGFIPKWNDPE